MSTSVVVGGAGFLGSHLVDELVQQSESVVVLDDLKTGRLGNLEAAISSGRVTLIYTLIPVPPDLIWNVVSTHPGGIRRIYDFASTEVSRASFPHLGEAIIGSHQAASAMIDLAMASHARLIVSSTLDALEQQTSSFREEIRKTVEDVVTAAIREQGLDAQLVRIAHCYGPRAHRPEDSIVCDLIDAIANARHTPLGANDDRRVHSMMYVKDAIARLLAVATNGESSVSPLFIGDDHGYTLDELAHLVKRIATRAERLRWITRWLRTVTPATSPVSDAMIRGLSTTPIEDGLRVTYEWFTTDRWQYV